MASWATGRRSTCPSAFGELDDTDALEQEQRRLVSLTPPRWLPGPAPIVAAAVLVAFARGEEGPGRTGDRAFLGAAATRGTTELDATGRDHALGAGLALHVGAVLDVPTVGVTHRPLLASGSEPEDVVGATSEVRLGSAVLGRWLRVHSGVQCAHRPSSRARTFASGLPSADTGAMGGRR